MLGPAIIWSDAFLESYKRELTMGEMKSRWAVANGIHLLEGSIVRWGETGQELLLLGYDATLPYGERALVALEWEGTAKTHRFSYRHPSGLVWTGGDDMEAAAVLIQSCGAQLHPISS